MSEYEGEFYRELRCTSCHKLICHEYIFHGRIRFECKRCSEVSTFTFKHRMHNKNATVRMVDNKQQENK